MTRGTHLVLRNLSKFTLRQTPIPQFAMVSFEDDNDQEILREALVTSQLRVEKETTDSSKEVLYNDGATPLFTAIEETKWADALDLLDVVPEQASIWVTSTGTENTTFGWSLWRRLPIHEVCILKGSLSVEIHFVSHGMFVSYR
jgi:hypothetical protein